MLKMSDLWFRKDESSVTSIMLVIIGGSYLITSCIFFKYPRLLHNVKKVKFKARHISHRGGAAEYYENTMTAFKKAFENGTEMFEIDCQVTKDGKVIVLHDYNLKRLTGVNIDVSLLPYHELPPLLEVLPIDFEPGNCYQHERPDKADRRIPLLEELFQEFSEMPMNIDIKTNNNNLIKGVNNLITHYKRENISVWGNATATISEKCYKMNPKINLLCSKRTVYFILLSYYTGLLPFIPIKETHLEICLPSIYFRWFQYRKNNAFDIIRSVGLKLFDLVLIRKSLFEHLQKRGIRVYLWVLNDDEEFERAFQVGADGVMTDYPTRLRQYLNSKDVCENDVSFVKQK